MDWRAITIFFRDRMIEANPQSGIISAENIALPNDQFDPRGLDIWFELATVTGLQGPFTEEEIVNQAYISLITCVPKNSGEERPVNIARRIKSLFSVQDGSHGCFNVDGNTVIIKECEQMPGIVINNVFKVSVRLFIEVYEPLT